MARKSYGIVLYVILFIMVLLPVRALDLGISPPDVNLKLNSGQVYQGEVYIFGSDEETMAINASLMDWSLSSTGEYQFLPLGTLKRSASPWITFNPWNFNLPPKRGQKITYTIKVPTDASGSYWGTIIFNTNPTTIAGKDHYQVKVAGRIAFIIRIDINGSPLGGGSIERFHLDWNPTARTLNAALRVKNSGVSFIRFKGRLELKDKQGQIVGKFPFKEGYVLPDSSREFTLSSAKLQLAPGFYVGLAVTDLGDRSLEAVQNSLEIP